MAAGERKILESTVVCGEEDEPACVGEEDEPACVGGDAPIVRAATLLRWRPTGAWALVSLMGKRSTMERGHRHVWDWAVGFIISWGKS
jgi:hypothetical protein